MFDLWDSFRRRLIVLSSDRLFLSLFVNKYYQYQLRTGKSLDFRAFA
uniref:Uncharacterized protein n=1 Tax=Arundo donax TaxID=35708 RepID=A0A0A8YW99_ARUDO